MAGLPGELVARLADHFAALELWQAGGLSGFAPMKPQRLAVASVEHHVRSTRQAASHVRNIVVTGLATGFESDARRLGCADMAEGTGPGP